MWNSCFRIFPCSSFTNCFTRWSEKPLDIPENRRFPSEKVKAEEASYFEPVTQSPGYDAITHVCGPRGSLFPLDSNRNTILPSWVCILVSHKLLIYMNKRYSFKYVDPILILIQAQKAGILGCRKKMKLASLCVPAMWFDRLYNALRRMVRCGSFFFYSFKINQVKKKKKNQVQISSCLSNPTHYIFKVF